MDTVRSVGVSQIRGRLLTRSLVGSTARKMILIPVRCAIVFVAEIIDLVVGHIDTWVLSQARKHPART
jgi:hypothetical protein